MRPGSKRNVVDFAWLIAEEALSKCDLGDVFVLWGRSQDKSSGDGGVHALNCGVGALALLVAVGVFASVVSLLLFGSECTI